MGIDFIAFSFNSAFSFCIKMAPMKKVCSDVLASFVEIACAEVKKNGIFTVPGLCRIKTRTKPATKAGVRNIFGKDVKVAAKPARKIVKAFPVAALKAQI